MKNNTYYSIITLVMLFLNLVSYSQSGDTYTTISNGNWNNSLNWDLGIAPDNDQTNGNDVIIITHHITLTDDLTVKSGTNITVSGCDTLHVTGNATFNNGSAILVENCAVLIIDGNVTNNNNSTDIQINGKIVIGGNYDGGTGSELTGTGAMEIEGDVTTDGGATVFGSTTDCDSATEECDNSASSPLPIELVFFKATLNSASIDLEWLTNSEINNDKFIIYKKHDDNWVEIASLRGAGNSNTPLMYSLTDNNLIVGYNYYKLVQVDYDGKRTEYKITSVLNRNLSVVDEDLLVYPNPSASTSMLNVELIGFNGEEVLLVIIDVLGKVYYEKAVYTENDNKVTIYDSVLPVGNYLVIGTSKMKLHHKKLTIK
jgi:hypothetical protein